MNDVRNFDGPEFDLFVDSCLALQGLWACYGAHNDSSVCSASFPPSR